MPKQTNLTPSEKVAILDGHLTKPVELYCLVGVFISGAMFTLEPGKGLCQYDLVAGELRVGIGHHIVGSLDLRLDGTLAIAIY